MIAGKKEMWDEWAGRQPNLLKEGGRLTDGDKIIPITKLYWYFDTTCKVVSTLTFSKVN